MEIHDKTREHYGHRSTELDQDVEGWSRCILERISDCVAYDAGLVQSLGVVEQTTRHSIDEVNVFFHKLEDIFAKDDFTKAQVVKAIKEFIPNFEHEEKGKNLDQKM